jgi:hypothetical protein
MIAIMMDANHISERLASMRRAIGDIQVIDAQYRGKSQHTALDKSAHALREGKLLGIAATAESVAATINMAARRENRFM